MDWWQLIKEWVSGLGKKYNVNPVIFSAIYLGAIPFFFASLGWLVRNIRRNKPVVIPVLCTGFFSISAYLYLIIAGENIPIWVYFLICLLIIYGIYSTVKAIKKKLNQNR